MDAIVELLLENRQAKILLGEALLENAILKGRVDGGSRGADTDGPGLDTPGRFLGYSRDEWDRHWARWGLRYRESGQRLQLLDSVTGTIVADFAPAPGHEGETR